MSYPPSLTILSMSDQISSIATTNPRTIIGPHMGNNHFLNLSPSPPLPFVLMIIRESATAK